MFVAHMIQLELNKFPHILKDCRSFVSSITKVIPKNSHKLCKFDVKHFFMSGQAHELATLACRLFLHDPKLRDLIFDAV